MSLRLRLTLWYGTLLTGALVAFGCVVYVMLSASLHARLDDAIRLRASQIARSMSPGADGLLSNDDIEAAQLRGRTVLDATPELYVQIYNSSGELVGASSTRFPIDPELLLQALDNTESLTTLPVGGGRRLRVITLPLATDTQVYGAVQVGDTLDAVDQTLAQVRTVLTAVSTVVIALGISGGLALAGRALAPIRQLSGLARRITATGDYSSRLVSPRRPDEVGELVETFNAMIGKVEWSLAEQRRFLADTSHELRTPLTVIRANLGFLWRDTDAMTRAECLSEAESEAARMSRLVADLLLLSQPDASEVSRHEALDLANILELVVDQARAQADGRAVDLNVGSRPRVLADGDRLRQVFWNLLGNAITHTPPGTHIAVGLDVTAEGASVSVSDDGPGIGNEHLGRVFDRFYRVDKARARSTGGAGLGLAIVKHIVTAHGGAVTVESQPGRGTTFTVTLPVLASHLTSDSTAMAANPRAHEASVSHA
ncbi:MAG: ATP-binding protein [Chloroflexota bacterium]